MIQVINFLFGTVFYISLLWLCYKWVSIFYKTCKFFFHLLKHLENGK